MSAGRARTPLRRLLAFTVLVAVQELWLKDTLGEELDRLALPFSDEQTPSDAELRIAQAQLVGWLEGLFHGIQAALFATLVFLFFVTLGWIAVPEVTATIGDWM